MSIEITEAIVKKVNERVMYYFEEISKIPRGSGKEQGIADYLVKFAKEHSFEYRLSSDMINGKQTHDVVICKPASVGYESLETVILQSHIDMVCQKVDGSTHNFDADPIKIKYDGDKMFADGTTLGADDGIGVACMLAVLESGEVTHPPIEALFTSDEEDGMTGAMAVTEKLITGRRLINIDTETEGTLYYGCAGGIDANFCIPVTYEPIPIGYSLIQIKLSGLLGGHSGVEIHKKHANAHKLMARTLLAVSETYPMYLASFTGGDKRNVITRAASAVVAVETAKVNKVISLVEEQAKTFIHEYEGIETAISLTALSSGDNLSRALSRDSLNKFLSVVLVIPNDVQAMHGKVEGLVETSCNLGIVRFESDQIYICSLIRSFFRTKKLYVLEQMKQLAKLAGASFSVTGDYPDWEPNPSSELIARFVDTYIDAFGKSPLVESIHAGLECGYFSEKFPYMDMIACGPTITGAHTPEETLYMSTVEKVVELLLKVLNKMDEAPLMKAMNISSWENTHDNTHDHTCQCIR